MTNLLLACITVGLYAVIQRLRAIETAFETHSHPAPVAIPFPAWTLEPISIPSPFYVDPPLPETPWEWYSEPTIVPNEPTTSCNVGGCSIC